MTRMIQCIKLGVEAEGLDRAPYPGELGQKIYLSVSKLAWKQWLNQQTMLINEYRLNMLDPKSREFLEQQMQAYFFGQGSDKPPGYQPEQAKK